MMMVTEFVEHKSRRRVRAPRLARRARVQRPHVEQGGCGGSRRVHGGCNQAPFLSLSLHYLQGPGLPCGDYPSPQRELVRGCVEMATSSASSSSSSSDAAPTVCKLVLLGNGSVGKTSLCARFRDDGFARVYAQTVGVDFYERRLRVRAREVALQVWDVGGQSLASAMMPQYVFGAAVVFLCYDVTDAQSFADVEDWLGLVDRAGAEADAAEAAAGRAGATARSARARPRAYLVGNKVDLGEGLRRVPAAQHEAFVARAARPLDGGFFVSARSGEAVLSAFYQAAARHLGLSLSAHEVEALQRVLKIDGGAGGGKDGSGGGADAEARTAFADEIERQDREAEQKRAQREAAGAAGCCALT
jgi:Ras-related protein Rab-28